VAPLHLVKRFRLRLQAPVLTTPAIRKAIIKDEGEFQWHRDWGRHGRRAVAPSLRVSFRLFSSLGVSWRHLASLGVSWRPSLLRFESPRIDPAKSRGALPLKLSFIPKTRSVFLSSDIFIEHPQSSPSSLAPTSFCNTFSPLQAGAPQFLLHSRVPALS
jgi:hypothetical protein